MSEIDKRNLSMHDPPYDQDDYTASVLSGGIARQVTDQTENEELDDDIEYDTHLKAVKEKNDKLNTFRENSEQESKWFEELGKYDINDMVKHGYYGELQKNVIPLYRNLIITKSRNNDSQDDIDDLIDDMNKINNASRRNMYYKLTHPEMMTREEKRKITGNLFTGVFSPAPLTEQQMEKLVSDTYNAYLQGGLIHTAGVNMTPEMQMEFETRMKLNIQTYYRNLEKNGMGQTVKDASKLFTEEKDSKKEQNRINRISAMERDWQTDPYWQKENASDRILADMQVKMKLAEEKKQQEVKEPKKVDVVEDEEKPVENEETKKVTAEKKLDVPESKESIETAQPDIPSELEEKANEGKEEKAEEKKEAKSEKPDKEKEQTSEKKDSSKPVDSNIVKEINSDKNAFENTKEEKLGDGYESNIADKEDLYPKKTGEDLPFTDRNEKPEASVEINADPKYQPNQVIIHDENGQKVEDTVSAVKNENGENVVHTESGAKVSEKDSSLEPKYAESAPNVVKEGEQDSELERLEKIKNQSGKIWRDYKTVTASINDIHWAWSTQKKNEYNPDKTMQENFVDFINKNGCKVVSVNKKYSSDMDSYTVENPSGNKFECYLEKVPNNNDPLATISYGFKISENKIADNMKKIKKAYDTNYKNHLDYCRQHRATQKTQKSSGPKGPSIS